MRLEKLGLMNTGLARDLGSGIIFSKEHVESPAEGQFRVGQTKGHFRVGQMSPQATNIFATLKNQKRCSRISSFV